MSFQPKHPAPQTQFRKRTYFGVPPTVECDLDAQKANLHFDVKTDKWYAYDDEVHTSPYPAIPNPHLDETPQYLRYYVKSVMADNNTLKAFKCRFDPIYRLWYASLRPLSDDETLEYVGTIEGTAYGANGTVLKKYPAAYDKGHRLRVI